MNQKRIGLVKDLAVLASAIMISVGIFYFWLMGQEKVSFPKIAVYWTAPTMAKRQAERITQFADLVIVDMENLVNNRPVLEFLKKKRPDLKILAYSNPMEFFVPMVPKRPLQKQLYDQVRGKYNAWWLRDSQGRRIVFWNGMRMMNLSTWCPLRDQERWCSYAAKFLLTNVLADPIWDGYFMDNSGGNISWVNKGDIDADNDGTKDKAQDLDRAWSAGVRHFLRLIRQAKGKDFIIIGNKGSVEFTDLLDGKMFEGFPNNYLGDKEAGGWYQCLENARQTGPYTIFQARQIPNNPAHRHFVLASAALAGVYYAYGQNISRFFPEYKKKIGYPLAGCRCQNGICLRRFSHGIAVVCPQEKKGEIFLVSPAQK